jgi:hypothetical protein
MKKNGRALRRQPAPQMRTRATGTEVPLVYTTAASTDLTMFFMRPPKLLKKGNLACNLLNVGDLGPLAILAVFSCCACLNKAILIAFT